MKPDFHNGRKIEINSAGKNLPGEGGWGEGMNRLSTSPEWKTQAQPRLEGEFFTKRWRSISPASPSPSSCRSGTGPMWIPSFLQAVITTFVILVWKLLLLLIPQKSIPQEVWPHAQGCTLGWALCRGPFLGLPASPERCALGLPKTR